MIGRGWGIALLALSVGLNLGLAVAVLQRRLAPPPTIATAPCATDVRSPAAAVAPPQAPAATIVPDAAAPTVVASPTAAHGAESRPGSGPAAEQRRSAASQERIPTVDVEPPAPAGAAPDEDRDAIARDDGGPFGEPPPPGPGMRGPSPARLEELAERLGVPPEDRPRFLELQRRFIAATKEHRLQLDMVRREMKRELMAANPDPERLQALVQTSAQLQAGLERALVEHVLAARKVLHGDAERRYLELLAQLGPHLGGGRPGPGPRPEMPPPDWRGRPRLPRDRSGGRWGRDQRLRPDERFAPDAVPSPPQDDRRPRAPAGATLTAGLELAPG